MKTRKVFAVILVAIAVMLSLCSCTPTKSPEKPKTGYEERALEEGFYVSTRPTNLEPCAFTTETNKFDIDNVEMTFYYGSSYIQQNDIFIDGFDLYFTDYHDYKRIFVRHSDDQFYSEKYRVSSEGEGDSAKRKFNYSEKIKIPAELFSENGGYLDFSLYGDVNIAGDFDLDNMCYIYESEYRCFAFISFYYRRYGRTIYLSEQYFESL